MARTGASKELGSSGLHGLLSVFATGVLVGVGVAVAERFKPPLKPPPPTESPTEFPARTWREAFVSAVREFNDDQIGAAAAAVTFFVLLAIFPALSAFVSLYGLVSDVGDAQREVRALSGLLPGGAVSVLGDELTRLTKTGSGALGFAFLVSVAISIWSANAGIKALIAALNVAYETRERRNFFHLNLVSLGFTVSAILAAVGAGLVLAAAPDMLARLGLARVSGLGHLRWPLLLLLAVVLFSVLYRFGPCRPRAHWRWVTPGGLIAAVGWVAMSALFSWYVANFGSYDKTYGSLGAAVGFLTWVWISLQVLLFGAELNAELERRAAKGGPVRPAR